MPPPLEAARALPRARRGRLPPTLPPPPRCVRTRPLETNKKPKPKPPLSAFLRKSLTRPDADDHLKPRTRTRTRERAQTWRRRCTSTRSTRAGSTPTAGTGSAGARTSRDSTRTSRTIPESDPRECGASTSRCARTRSWRSDCSEASGRTRCAGSRRAVGTRKGAGSGTVASG